MVCVFSLDSMEKRWSLLDIAELVLFRRVKLAGDGEYIDYDTSYSQDHITGAGDLISEHHLQLTIIPIILSKSLNSVHWHLNLKKTKRKYRKLE